MRTFGATSRPTSLYPEDEHSEVFYHVTRSATRESIRRYGLDWTRMTLATVRWFRDEEGWGVLDAPEAPGGIFVHFSALEVEGFKTLRDGQTVEVELEGPLSFDQDGYRFRAITARPLD